MEKNKVIVEPTKRCKGKSLQFDKDYTIRLVINGNKFNLGTGGYGLTLNEAVNEGKAIAAAHMLELEIFEV